MAVRRIKPNILSERFDESRDFYSGVIGLEEGSGLDWILFFGTDRREVQLSVMKLDVKAHVHPDVSIEVDDVDAAHERARAAGAEIVYPLTDEEWGLRRFFVRDPNGAVINVTEHRMDEQEAPETKGVSSEVLATVDLGAEIEGMAGRQLRMRMVTIDPGGVFGPVHDHKDRPGMVYVLQGTITDHRDGVATDYGPGVGWPEDRNTMHWLENRGTVPAVEISVDIVRHD